MVDQIGNTQQYDGCSQLDGIRAWLLPDPCLAYSRCDSAAQTI